MTFLYLQTDRLYHFTQVIIAFHSFLQVSTSTIQLFTFTFSLLLLNNLTLTPRNPFLA